LPSRDFSLPRYFAAHSRLHVFQYFTQSVLQSLKYILYWGTKQIKVKPAIYIMLVFLDCLHFNKLLEILRSMWCNFSNLVTKYLASNPGKLASCAAGLNYCGCVPLNGCNAQIALRAVSLIAHNASGCYKWTTSGDKNERSQCPR